MATFKKLASGKWQAQVARKGIRKSASFATKREAQDWAARQEFLATNVETSKSNLTLGDVFDRYAKEESPKRRGERWEAIRLTSLGQYPIASKLISDLKPQDLAEWRDSRLKEVSAGTVRREMVLMSSVLTTARKEWGLLSSNPMSDIRKPSSPPARDRRVSDGEIERLMTAAGTDLLQATARAVHAFRFAIETAMRAGEVVGLTEDSVDRKSRVASLPITKNGTARQVPLSSRALALLEELPDSDVGVFGLNSRQIDVLFRKARDKAGIEDLRFHDSRHEAITRLSKKLDVLSLARMVGHKDIRMLQIYYNETAEELAQRLD
ncbi:shufflon-specific DNA recombinase [Roseibium sp. TrichSKD4]|uniref:tyrosine-type recombinase/integrase n=1 Tax=Roseibium sp. TrichSKD4 TaxID=744980 RepID=UPI0001E56AF6|nr:site-specific integrase [Roseibium sp. TrichSKD4]EFO32574.1 shufflon-specific DNA recombinase [Roseibium sp. TrichSKD4]